MAEDTNGEYTATTPLGSFAIKGKRGAEVIAFTCLLLLFLLAYVIWEHKSDTKESNAALTGAIKELNLSQRAAVEAQREMTCVISLPQEKREHAYSSPYSVCKQIARER
jgi:hypothetical protein